MQGLWSSFNCIADWKRRLIFFAVLAGVAGMLWETNDLIRENPNHPLIAPEASLMNFGFDEFGDPYARAERVKPLPYSKVWSSPVTHLCFAFILAMIIGSLFRSLISGSVALIAIIALTTLLVGRESVFDFFSEQDTRSAIEPVGQWFAGHVETVKQFLWTSLPSACAAVTGLVMGLMK